MLLFVMVRLPGLNLSYHQDEWKIVRGVELGASGTSGLFHPPLTQLLFRGSGALFGAEHMRILPLLFSVFSALLLFAVVRRRASQETALVSLFLYVVSFYSIWSSLMIDTDGAILPTFFLLAVYSYDRQRWWLLGLALLLGLMVKLSFILVVGTLLIDFLWANYKTIGQKQIRHLFLALFGLFGSAVVTVFVVSWVYPAFSLSGMIEHVRYFAHISGRNYLQIIIQAMKSWFYLSPMLLAPLILISRESFKKMRVFLIYLLLGLIFYFVLFDFSRGALDKYLMFSIVPLCVLVGDIIATVLRASRWRIKSPHLFLGAILSVFLVVLNFVPQVNAPLYPKDEWFGRVVSGHWNILTPFTGGSGPVGFYVSFLFIIAVFLASFLLVVLARYLPKLKYAAVTVFLILGLSYNLVFAEELFWGGINGSVSAVLVSTVSFLRQAKEIKQIITYNDIGAYELSKIDKYVNRFYAAPQFESNHRQRFSEFGGQYLVINLPPLYQGFYSEFFAKCATLFTSHSGVITAQVYSCPQKNDR